MGQLLCQPLILIVEGNCPAHGAGKPVKHRRVYIYTRYLTVHCQMCIYLHMERNSKNIVTRLKAEGWTLVSVKGSHHKFRKDAVTLIVPHPKKDLPIGTARSIAKMAGWI